MTSTTFAELALSAKVLAAVEAAGYSVPTPIQEQAIPVAVTGKDILGIAQTGTGKTASFVLPMITRLESGRARARMPRSLILAPTRELAAQVAQSFEKYGVNHKLNVALLIGGVSMDDQIAKLDRGADVLIATPGRMLDHFQRGRLMLMGVEILVIDEADRMLDMGFIPDIEKICKLLPPKRQTLFFSATMPPEITRLVDQFLNDPQRIEVARPATTAKTITQRFYFCPNGEDWAKRDELRKIIRSQQVKNAIIFCNRKRDVAILLKSLLKHGFNAGALHGDMDQTARMATLDSFRSGKITFLAASDVAARGLDIPDVSHVFNFDVPWAGDDYVHRIGRTGRAGKEGISETLVAPDDLKLVADIEKITGEPALWIGEPPTEEDFADAGRKKRRGRGGRGAAAPARDTRRGSSERSSGRGGRRERGSGDRDEPRLDARQRSEAAPNTPIQSDSGRNQSSPHDRSEAPHSVAVNETASTRERAARPPRAERPRRDRGQSEQRGDGNSRPERGPRTDRGQSEPHAASERRQSRPERARPEQARPEQVRPDQARAHQSTERPGAATPRQAASGNKQRGGRGESDAPMGFADNVPAFLQRPVRRPAKAES